MLPEQPDLPRLHFQLNKIIFGELRVDQLQPRAGWVSMLLLERLR